MPLRLAAEFNRRLVNLQPPEMEIVMDRAMLLAAFGLVMGVPSIAHAQAALPMFNGTCPGGLEVHADEGGPVYVNGRETRLNRSNDNYFEASDARSGVTLSISRSPDGSMSMSYTGKGGANGVCTVDAPARTESHAATGTPAGEVTCESRGREQNECDMDTHGDIQLVRQLSKSECVQGENWGLYHHSVWVKDGCRAVFRNVSGSRGWSARPVATGSGAELLAACNARAGASGTVLTRIKRGRNRADHRLPRRPVPVHGAQ